MRGSHAHEPLAVLGKLPAAPGSRVGAAWPQLGAIRKHCLFSLPPSRLFFLVLLLKPTHGPWERGRKAPQLIVRAALQSDPHKERVIAKERGII